jgi:hypothetical protein
VPVLYVAPGLRRRLRAAADGKLDHLAGALVGRAPTDVEWRLTETLRGLAVVYGLEVSSGSWPPAARPALRLHRGRIVGAAADHVPVELVQALMDLQVETWEALLPPEPPAFRFTPLGACHVVSIFPPMRYTRGLNDEEARLVLEVVDLSSRIVESVHPG